MANIWNSLTRTGSIGFDEIDEELRKYGIDPATILGNGGNTNPAIENAMPNTPAANPSLRRLASPGGGFDNDPERMPSGRLTNDPNIPDGGLSDSLPQERPRRRSEISGEELQDARDMPRDTPKAKQKGWWRRFGAGIGDNLRSGGDWFTAATQGVSEAIDPSQRADRIKERKDKKIWNRYSQDVQQEGVEAKQAMDAQKLRNEQFELQEKRFRRMLDGFAANDVYTDQEADIATAAGFPMLPYDARQNDLQWVNGKPMNAPKKGAPNYVRNPTLSDDLGKTRTDTTIDAGGKTVTLPLTPAEAARTLVGAQERAERTAAAVQRRNDEIADKEYKDTKDYQGDLRDWSQRNTKARAQKAKAQAALPKLRESRESLAAQQYDTTQIEKSIADMEGDIAEADELLKERKPSRVIRKKGDSGGGKKRFKMSDVDRVIQGK